MLKFSGVSFFYPSHYLVIGSVFQCKRFVIVKHHVFFYFGSQYSTDECDICFPLISCILTPYTSIHFKENWSIFFLQLYSISYFSWYSTASWSILDLCHWTFRMFLHPTYITKYCNELGCVHNFSSPDF